MREEGQGGDVQSSILHVGSPPSPPGSPGSLSSIWQNAVEVPVLQI